MSTGDESNDSSPRSKRKTIDLDTRFPTGLDKEQEKHLPRFLQHIWSMLHEPKVLFCFKFFFGILYQFLFGLDHFCFSCSCMCQNAFPLACCFSNVTRLGKVLLFHNVTER